MQTELPCFHCGTAHECTGEVENRLITCAGIVAELQQLLDICDRGGRAVPKSEIRAILSRAKIAAPALTHH